MQQDRQHLFCGEQRADEDDDEIAVDAYELPPPPANPQVRVVGLIQGCKMSEYWKRVVPC